MPPRYLRHLTLDTGDQRDSYRREVADEVVELLRPLLDRAVAGETVALPAGDPPCTMTAATGRDRALLVTVWGPPAGEQRVPLVTIGVAPSSRASAALWREWLGRERDDRTPSAPWCAVKLQPGLLIYTRAADWLGDLEACIAWAWIDQDRCGAVHYIDGRGYQCRMRRGHHCEHLADGQAGTPLAWPQ